VLFVGAGHIVLHPVALLRNEGNTESCGRNGETCRALYCEVQVCVGVVPELYSFEHNVLFDS
jgi:hypothetical protein